MCASVCVVQLSITLFRQRELAVLCTQSFGVHLMIMRRRMGMMVVMVMMMIMKMRI